MGDRWIGRCWMEVRCREADIDKFEAIGFEVSDCHDEVAHMVCVEANYEHYHDLLNIAKAGTSFVGWHGASGDYVACRMASHGGNFREYYDDLIAHGAREFLKLEVTAWAAIKPTKADDKYASQLSIEKTRDHHQAEEIRVIKATSGDPVTFRLSKTQMKVMRSNARHTLLLARRGFGKTYVGALWAVTRMAKSPGSIGLVYANKHMQLSEVVLRRMTTMLDKMGIGWVYGSRPPWDIPAVSSYAGVLSIDNGSICHCRTPASSGMYNALRGPKAAWAWLDECNITRSVLDVVVACFRGQGNEAYQVLLTTTTPNWFDGAHDAFRIRNPLPDSIVLRERTAENSRNLPLRVIPSTMEMATVARSSKARIEDANSACPRCGGPALLLFTTMTCLNGCE